MAHEEFSLRDFDTFSKKMHRVHKKNIVKTNTQNIQKVLHHIWLTHSESPREPLATDLENVFITKNFSLNQMQVGLILFGLMMKLLYQNHPRRLKHRE